MRGEWEAEATSEWTSQFSLGGTPWLKGGSQIPCRRRGVPSTPQDTCHTWARQVRGRGKAGQAGLTCDGSDHVGADTSTFLARCRCFPGVPFQDSGFVLSVCIVVVASPFS